MKHIHYYTVKMNGQTAAHFATRELAERSIRISYNHHPNGLPRLFEKVNGLTEIRQGPFTMLKYERTRTDPESGTLIGTIQAVSVSVYEGVTHL